VEAEERGNKNASFIARDLSRFDQKQKLPPELSGQLDSLLSGQESSSGIMDAVKGLSGKKDS